MDDLAVRQHRRPVRSGHPRLVAALAQVQELPELARGPIDHVRGELTLRHHLGEVVDERHVVGFHVGHLPMMTAPGGELGDDEPDDEQADRRLEIGSMADGQPLVGPGEEVVEPQSRRHRGEDARRPRPQDGHGGDDGDEDQCRRGACERGAHGHEGGGHDERCDHAAGGGQRRLAVRRSGRLRCRRVLRGRCHRPASR